MNTKHSSNKLSSHYHLVSAADDTDDHTNISKLEQEIELLEKELDSVELQIRAMESQIQSRYRDAIVRIRELSKLYKLQKNGKKEKRREQKKRGKNYREPTALKTDSSDSVQQKVSLVRDSHELKKLYREAVLKVHPDKFANDTHAKSKRSQELTIELIDIYQSGDLEKLKHIYHHIMSGNAMELDTKRSSAVHPDPDAMRTYLVRKRDDLLKSLDEAKGSRIYEVLTTYADPSVFVNELAVQLSIRISQLERRTRVKNNPVR